MTAAHTRSIRHQTTHRSLGIEWLVLVVAIVAVVIAAAWSGESNPVGLSTAQVKAHQGDTLWSLASAHPIKDLSTAQTAALIAELNGVQANVLAAGTSVRVPVCAPASSYAMR